MSKGSRIKSKGKRPNAPGEWYQLVELFDPEEGVFPATPEGLPPVVVQGKLSDVPIVQLPVTATAAQARRVSEVIEEACGVLPIVITNNVRLLKMRRVSEKQAKGMLEDAKLQVS